MSRFLALPSLDHAATAAVDAIRRATLWWFDQLRELIPPSIRRRFERARTAILVKSAAEGMELIDASGHCIFCIDRHGTAALPDKVRSAIAAADTVVLQLPRDAVLIRTLELPLAAEARLADAVSFEIDRQTPYSADRVYSGCRITRRDIARNTLRVDLAVVRREIVDSALINLRKHDITVSSCGIEGDEAATGLELLPPQYRFRNRSWRREPWKPIAACTVALLLFGSIAIAWYLDNEADTLGSRVAATGTIARKSAALQEDIQRRASAIEFLPQKLAGPRAVEIVDTLTQTLPDDTWIFDLELKGQEIHIAGFSADVPGILEKLQASPLFGSPKLTEPVVHGASKTGDRFSISVAIKGKASP